VVGRDGLIYYESVVLTMATSWGPRFVAAGPGPGV